MQEKELLIKFYKECSAKGYNDMSDSDQSLKAKVIASDLGLDYQHIHSLYERAKKEYELSNLKGECLFNVYSNDTLYKVFKCSNGKTYCESKNIKYENVNFTVKPRNIISYTYHPSKVIYTGASSGGIAMGGFHETQDYTTLKSHKSENGYISMSANGLSDINVTKVTIDKNIYQLTKVELYILGFDQTILCEKEVSESMREAQMQVLMDSYSKGSAAGASTASVINKENSLSINECETISNLLIDILSNKVTKRTKKEYLEEIKKLIESDDINSLSRAKKIIEYFNTPEFNNYLDELTPKYDEAIQKIKERKIIEEEQELYKENKKVLAKVIGAILVSLIAGIIATISVAKNGEIFWGIMFGAAIFLGCLIGFAKAASSN